MHLFDYGSRHHTYCSYFDLHVLSSCTIMEPILKAIPEAQLLQGRGAGWWLLFEANAFSTSSPVNFDLLQLFMAHLCCKDNCSFEVQVLALEWLCNLLTRYWLKYQDILSIDKFLSYLHSIEDNVYNRSCHLWARWKMKLRSIFQEGPWLGFELMSCILHGKMNKTSFLKADKKYHRDRAKLDTVIEEEA